MKLWMACCLGSWIETQASTGNCDKMMDCGKVDYGVCMGMWSFLIMEVEMGDGSI